jgi:hypothetical protein
MLPIVAARPECCYDSRRSEPGSVPGETEMGNVGKGTLCIQLILDSDNTRNR